MSVALITGGSAGLGRALAHALAEEGWRVVVDGRDPERLAAAARHPEIVAVPGDVTNEWHRGALAAAVEREGRLDLLVHNASSLGPTPLPRLEAVTVDDLDQVWRTNVAAPLALTVDLMPLLTASRGVLMSISSDAGVEHYEGWGLYGATKAALDHVTLTFGEENPLIAAYAVDPGDMRTQMHQEAFPGEDISDRPLPETVVPHLLALVAARPPSGRHRAADVTVVARTAQPVGG
jgi:NAD(P)-dependent dehydrogenase (short-subunit alcohol dehydrogenase family)